MTPKTRFTIGRDRSCDIPIADDSVSRLHAEITLLDGGKLFLTDCHSSNSSFVVRDGKARKIHQEMILASDRVKFGDVEIAVSDLLESIKPKVAPRPQAGSAVVARPAAASTSPMPENSRLVRCECGMIVPEGKKCPACGA